MIQPDGSILVPRGNAEQNHVSMGILQGQTGDDAHLEHFFEVADESELLFGDSELCG